MNSLKRNSVGSGSNRSNSSNRSPKNYRSRSRSISRSPSPVNKYASRKSSSRDRHRSRKSYSRSPSIVKRRGRTNNENPEPCTCIGIFGLSKRTDEQELQDTFEKFGRIKSVKLIMDKYQNESLGYGFINYEDLDSATRAIKEGNGMTIDGKDVRVDYSITKKAHTPTPGSYKGKISNRRTEGFNNNRREFFDRRRSRSRSYDRRGSNRRSSPYKRNSPPRNSYKHSSYRSSYNRSPPMRSFDRRSRSRSYERSSKRYH